MMTEPTAIGFLVVLAVAAITAIYKAVFGDKGVKERMAVIEAKVDAHKELFEVHLARLESGINDVKKHLSLNKRCIDKDSPPG